MKSVKDIEDLVSFSSLPFIANGIMLPDEAQNHVDAGVNVISVSNHGRRVLDSTPGVATMLPLIREKLGDPVIITAAAGQGPLGVKLHFEHIQKTLTKAMFMTRARNIKMIDSKILFDFI